MRSWNSLPAAIIRSRLRHCHAQTKRGHDMRADRDEPAFPGGARPERDVSLHDVIFIRVLRTCIHCGFSVP
jgi:hypothetical protein